LEHDLGPARHFFEGRRKRYLATESRISGDETDGFDDPLRQRQLHEPHIDHVLSTRRLAAEDALIRRIEQRHPISAPNPWIKLVISAGGSQSMRASGSRKAA